MPHAIQEKTRSCKKMLKTSKTLRPTKNRDGKGQSGSKENAKTDLEKMKTFDTKRSSRHFEQRILKQAGRPPEASERRTCIRRLCSWTMIFCESPLNVKDEDRAEVQTAVDFCQNSWTARKDERGKRHFHRRSTKSNQKLKVECSEDGITAEIPEALPEKQKEALAENLNGRCKDPQFDEGFTKKQLRSSHPKIQEHHIWTGFRQIACLTTMMKLMGYLWMMTLRKIKCESFRTAFMKNNHPPRGALSIVLEVEEKQKSGTSHFYEAQIDLKKSVRPCGQKPQH